MTPKKSRIDRQVRFIVEIDRLKQICRQTYLTDASRFENSVEHSWHLAMLAMVFSEYANDSIDVSKVIRMVLIHDIVEIDAGDTFIYDEIAAADKAARETAAAERIFNLLPEDQAQEFRGLWNEFEARSTADARFAHALDRFQPILHNIVTNGKAWHHHGIRKHQVLEKNRVMAEGADALWDYTADMIENAAADGLLPE